ncbi:1-acyl-sn-glycerol-3-phosphate acyltransferase [Desulfatibacillum aliphaticivorans]|uniref:1-acyl-sn-glycerol-3-phosphate acyltransferase n=1 Tax=Desulfatibacillum aliphaticivorans TaxID=218208 RepID=B8FCG1_DESAL|nr:lysophospholipid acyltransferase family protein [Desulfatibacillum aliphaticivorans]ACL05579.1 1-acyl-sn-glycerol-3-phosphate acyltransferase [Desulfatibacillum aliphaticivorans]
MNRKLYKFYKWLVVVPVLAVSTCVFGLLAMLLCTFMDPKFVGQITGVPWAKLNSIVTPMRVKILGRENIDPKQSYVICANHQSQYDIFVLYGQLGIDFKWVMKAELRSVPFLGAACARLGHIFIDRSDTEKALASINAAKEKIVNGTSVLFFPEGTRSRDGKLLRFKKGAFTFALDLGLPILPVTIVGTKDILPTDTLDLYCGNATMIIHPAIETSGYDKENLPDLMSATREVIEKGLTQKS